MTSEKEAQIFRYVAIAVVVVAGMAYLVFLGMTWRQLQDDRITRNEKVDALLDKLNDSTKTEPSGTTVE